MIAASNSGTAAGASPPAFLVSALEHLRLGLERRLSPQVRLAGRPWPLYGIFVVLGGMLGVAAALTLAWIRLLPISLTLGVVAAGVLAALALALGTVFVLGRERFTFYYYQWAVLLAGVLAAALMGRPPLLQLDLLAVALATTQALGRLGCLAAGCCHGRPHPLGLSYRSGYAEFGLEPSLTGIRLLPAPLLESIWLSALSVLAALTIVAERPAGQALALYLAGHALGRFFFEFVRGDAGRPYFRGFSEAQWTSLAVSLLVFGGVAAGIFVWSRWIVTMSSTPLVAAAAVKLKRIVDPRRLHRLAEPGHFTELSRFLKAFDSAIPSSRPLDHRKIPVATTSQGLRISAGGAAGSLHYCLSKAGTPLCEAAAQMLAVGILRLRPGFRSYRLIQGTPGVFHLLLRASAEDDQSG